VSEPLDELYLRWLYSQVANVRLKTKSRTYWDLLRQLYTKEFVWIIPNDDNRLEDGRDLRDEFVYAERLYDVDPEWMALGCSMLEVLIGVARRLFFEEDSKTIAEWFWVLLRNLELDELNDRTIYDDRVVDEILDQVIWRTYLWDGSGGLFPLKYATEDQREVEIWYQLSAYLLENA
jgi:hypothetical protein